MNLLSGDIRSLEYCTYCPKLCRHACPVSNAEPREALIPQQKMQTAGLLRKSHLPWQPAYTEPLYACTGCGACTEACAHSIEPGRVLTLARASAEEHQAAHPRLAGFSEAFALRGRRLAARLRDQVPASLREARAQVVFHPACASIGSDELTSALVLLGRVLPAFAVTATETPCAGYPLWAAGLGDAFRNHARRFAKALRGYDTFVSSCPACVHLVKRIYPREVAALAPNVRHLVELLDERAAGLPRVEPRRPVLYQDPCFLGRIDGVYDAPRRLLARVAEVEEFSRCRVEAECSGGGGLVPKTMPEVAVAMARRRLAEAQERGAALVVTACPTCKKQLDSARTGIAVVDLVALLDRSFRGRTT